MDRTLRAIALVAILGLLAAILAVLIVIALHGLRISYEGQVRMVGIPGEIALRVAEPVVLTLPGGATLDATVSGVQSAPVPVAFASATCPTCGRAMVPVRYDLLTGEIRWACPACDGLP